MQHGSIGTGEYVALGVGSDLHRLGLVNSVILTRTKSNSNDVQVMSILYCRSLQDYSKGVSRKDCVEMTAFMDQYSSSKWYIVHCTTQYSPKNTLLTGLVTVMVDVCQMPMQRPKFLVAWKTHPRTAWLKSPALE
jgi:hypothetical protein